MDHLCRFCGLDLVDKTKYLIANNEVITRFYCTLPSEVWTDDTELPKNCCKICKNQISELVEFYDSVLVTNRNLRDKLNHQIQIKANELSPPAANQVRLRRLSELTTNKIGVKHPRTVLGSSANASKRKRVAKTSKTVLLSLDQTNFVCGWCKGKFNSEESLCKHLKTSNDCKDTQITCKECKKVLSTRISYFKHMYRVHGKEKTPKFICKNCKEVFSRESELNNHQLLSLCIGVKNEDISGNQRTDCDMGSVCKSVPHLEKDFCSVFGCTSERSRGAVLHYFPKDQALRTKWRNALKFTNNFTDNALVCNLHFTENDYTFASTPTGRRKWLRPGVVPSQDLPQFKQEVE